MKRLYLLVFISYLTAGFTLGLMVGCNTEAVKNDNTIQQHQKMKEISTRWKKEHWIDDFHWLKDNCIKPGDSLGLVKEVLGEPLNTSRTDDGTEYWLYVKCNDEKKQFYTYSLLFDSNGKVAGWYEKGIK